MKVKFSKDFKAKGGKEYKKDVILDITETTATTLVEKGFAAKYEEPAPVESEFEVVEQEEESEGTIPAEGDAIEKSVSKALAKFKKEQVAEPPQTQDVRVVNKKYRGKLGSEELAYGFGCLLLSKGMKQGQLNPLAGMALDRIKSGFAGRLGGYTKKDVSAFTGTGAIPTIWIEQLVKLMQQYGVARKHCWMHPMATVTEDLPKSTIMPTVYAVAKAADIPTSNLGDTPLTLTAVKRGLVAYMPREVIEDAVVDYGEEQAIIISRAFARSEDETLFNQATYDPTGTMGVIGIAEALTADTYGFVQVASGASGTNFGFSYADFLACAGNLPPFADEGDEVRWYMNKAFYFQVALQSAITAGAARLNELMTVVSGPRQQMFCGYPVVFTQVMPASVTGNGGKFAAFLGNLRMAVAFGVRREYSIESTLYGPGWLQDLISYRATERVAQTVYGTSTMENTAGPVVALRAKNIGGT